MKTIKIEKAGVQVIVRDTLVSVLFDGELVDQYRDYSITEPTEYATQLVKAFGEIMRTASSVPNLNQIGYA